MKTFFNTHNPLLLPEFHVPDSEAHVFSDGNLYLYGSYDLPDYFFCSPEYHVVSTSDMKTWTVHDISLSGEDIPWFGDPEAPRYPGSMDSGRKSAFMSRQNSANSDESEGEQAPIFDPSKLPRLLFAPDCIEKDGRYYLYFCMVDQSEGVAVSSSPVGPFENPTRLPVGGIDPAIFVDDDGQAYYYWDQFWSRGVRLNRDMISLDPEEIRTDLVTEEEHFFHEGSSMRKIGNTYYYVFADMERGKPTSLGYATGNDPLGPFTYRGIIIDNDGCDPQSWNNHGSIACFNGQWYIFYHRSSRNSQKFRRLCCEKITVLPDGSIPEVKMTSQGPGEPFGPGEIIHGYQACGLTGKVYIDEDQIYGEKLTSIAPGDTAVFRYVKNDTDWSGITLTGRGTGVIRVMMNGKPAGTLNVNGEKDEEVIVSAPLNMPAGEYELQLSFEESCELEVLTFTLK